MKIRGVSPPTYSVPTTRTWTLEMAKRTLAQVRAILWREFSAAPRREKITTLEEKNAVIITLINTIRMERNIILLLPPMGAYITKRVVFKGNML